MKNENECKGLYPSLGLWFVTFSFFRPLSFVFRPSSFFHQVDSLEVSEP